MFVKTNILVYKKLKSVFICIAFFSCFVLSASSQNFLDFRLKLTVKDGNYEHAKVVITKDGKPFRIVDSKSKYDIDLDLGFEYQMTATKLGYVTKTIIVDTHVPDGRQEDDFNRFEAEIILEPQPEGAEVTYTQAVGRIAYSKQEKDFDFDKDYSARVQEMMKKAEAEPRKLPPKEIEKEPEEKPKPEKEPFVSKPEEIKKEVTYPSAKNPVPPKEKVIPPPIPPTIRTVVERTVQQDKLKITYRTVTINGVDMVYRKEEFSWGGVYFYKENRNITEALFEKDTK